MWFILMTFLEYPYYKIVIGQHSNAVTDIIMIYHNQYYHAWLHLLFCTEKDTLESMIEAVRLQKALQLFDLCFNNWILYNLLQFFSSMFLIELTIIFV